jgi:hypothetical protein
LIRLVEEWTLLERFSRSHMIKPEDIRVQIEYYLGDANLKRDEFFYSKVLENDQGWVDISCFLACNKVKNLGCTKESIVESVKDSTEVEVNPTGDKLRRINNKALPEATFKSKKLKVQGKPEGSNLVVKQFP